MTQERGKEEKDQRDTPQNSRSSPGMPPPADPLPTESSALGQTTCQQVLDRLLQLPQVEGEIWQASICQFPIAVECSRGMLRPWMLVVVNATFLQTANQLIESVTVQKDEPASKMLWETLVNCMQHPLHAEPHRPAEIHVRLAAHGAAWALDLESIGVKCVVGDNLGLLDFFVRMTAERVAAATNAAPIDLNELAELPQNPAEVWQASDLLLPTWCTDDDGTVKRPE